MIIDKKIKLIVFPILLIIVILLTVMLTVYGVNLGIAEVKPVKKLISQKTTLEIAQSNLITQQGKFQTAVKNVDTAKQAFNDEKKKYDAISDETINIIKEATTEENYSMEYLWIKLGNYAKKNNLSIIVAEPGGALPTTVTTKDETDKTDKPTSGDDTTQFDTKTTPPQTTTTAPKSTPTPPQASANTPNNNSNTTPNNQTNNLTPPTITQNPTDMPSITPPSSNSADTFKIQVSGSYIDVSDFVFEVENDKELRFKLDNIKMIPVEGTKIITTFDIKKVIVKK